MNRTMQFLVTSAASETIKDLLPLVLWVYVPDVAREVCCRNLCDRAWLVTDESRRLLASKIPMVLRPEFYICGCYGHLIE